MVSDTVNAMQPVEGNITAVRVGNFFINDAGGSLFQESTARCNNTCMWLQGKMPERMVHRCRRGMMNGADKSVLPVIAAVVSGT